MWWMDFKAVALPLASWCPWACVIPSPGVGRTWDVLLTGEYGRGDGVFMIAWCELVHQSSRQICPRLPLKKPRALLWAVLQVCRGPRGKDGDVLLTTSKKRSLSLQQPTRNWTPPVTTLSSEAGPSPVKHRMRPRPLRPPDCRLERHEQGSQEAVFRLLTYSHWDNKCVCLSH